MLALTLHPNFMKVLWNFYNIHTSSTHFFLRNPFCWCCTRDYISVFWADCTSIHWFMYPGGDTDWAQSPLYKNIFNVYHTTTANRGHCPVLQLLAIPYEMGCESCAFKLIRAIFLYLKETEGWWVYMDKYRQVEIQSCAVQTPAILLKITLVLTYSHCQSVTRIFHIDAHLLCLSLTHSRVVCQLEVNWLLNFKVTKTIQNTI